MTDINARMLDREMKKGSAELLILALVDCLDQQIAFGFVLGSRYLSHLSLLGCSDQK